MSRSVWIIIALVGSLCCSAEYAGEIPTYRKEVISWNPRIVLLRSFLSEGECDHLIQAARPHLQRSKVLGDASAWEKMDARRTSEGMFFSDRGCDPVISILEERIANLTLIPIEHGESLQVLHYGIGAEYCPHYDFFDSSTETGRTALARGGQRTATIIMYLHTTPQGGATIFPLLDIRIQPRKGDALLFYDCLPNGEVDTLTLHGGAPVLEGEKWIATKWLRAEAFH